MDMCVKGIRMRALLFCQLPTEECKRLKFLGVSNYLISPSNFASLNCAVEYSSICWVPVEFEDTGAFIVELKKASLKPTIQTLRMS